MKLIATKKERIDNIEDYKTISKIKIYISKEHLEQIKINKNAEYYK